MAPKHAAPKAFGKQLFRGYAVYTLGFCLLVLLLALFELMGLARQWIGYVFLLVTVALYAGIGIMCRTSDPIEYYVAGRRVPAVYNGMATAADWMSVASFIGVAGTLYLTGYNGLAYILGWTGGYVLVALFLAPYLRKFGRYTIPDFLGARFGGNAPRLLGVLCAVLCSFTYLVAQIYGVGLITTRMTGISFELGIFIALGGVLVCSFLGGMRAVTWTQVGQYIILLIAYLVPVIWLAVKQTGDPVPQRAAGAVLQQVTERERELKVDESELSVRALWQARAENRQVLLAGLPESLEAEQQKLRLQLLRARANDASMGDVRALERELAAYPKTVEQASMSWSKARDEYALRAMAPQPHATPFASRTNESADVLRNNFLAIVLCLMMGTAGLPHILMRSFTTPSVDAARKSVFWSLFFILLLYLMAPALAILVKFEIYANLVGSQFTELPSWVHAWSAVDRSLLSIVDLNKDNIVQLAEIQLGADVVVLAAPGIGPAVLRQLRRAFWPVGARLDLHGLNSDQARARVLAFIENSQNHRTRCVCIIHGVGYGSANGQAVLPVRVRQWLKQLSAVSAFAQAPQAHGGAGALLALIRSP